MFDEYQELGWIVQVRCGGTLRGWESMAAFNVDSVAAHYAEECKKTNPHNDYRVLHIAAPVVTRSVTFETKEG